MKQEEINEIALIGLNHTTASVEMREIFSLNDDDVSMILTRSDTDGIDEIVCVSTCNRVEIYFASSNIHDSFDSVISILEDISSLTREKFESIVYKKYAIDAVQHLLTVTSSLDSMVIGENEILGQIKDSYRQSVSAKRVGTVLNRLFHQAFNTAKRVRTETEISKNPLSVAYIATELAKNIFEDISKRRALLIGAGEMGELILKYLSKYNICDITIANRSFHNAEKIAKEINRGINIIPLDDIPETVLKADIIISSISPTNYIIPYDMAKNALKRKNVNSPTFFIDIAVPRSIDPKIAKLDKMFLYNIDDLKSIADDNLKSRLKEVELAKRLIEMDTDDFYKWYKGLSVVPAIIKIQDRFNEIRTHELNKYRRRKLKHITEEDFKIIEDLTNQIMTKTLHNPITYLKSCLEQCNNKFDDEVDDILEKKKIIEDLFAYENGDE